MPANQSHLHAGIYSGAEIKEGVMEYIYQISSEEVVLLDRLPVKTAINVKHEWNTRTRGTRVGTSGRHRAVPPGDQFNIDLNDFENLVVPVRDVNYAEIFRVLPRVDRSTLLAPFWGINDIMSDQIGWWATQIGIYLEERLWNGTQAAGPASAGLTTAWQLGGVTTELNTNQTAGGDPDDVKFQTVIIDCYTDGGRPGDAYMGPRTKLEFVQDLAGQGSVTRFLNTSDPMRHGTVSQYEGVTDHPITLHITRDLDDTSTTADIWLLDHSQLALAYYDPPFIERLPRMGDDERARIQFQVTFEFGDKNAHGSLINITHT